MNRDMGELTDEVRQACIEAILENIDELNGRDPGVLFAQQLLDKIIETAGPDIKRKYLTDIKKIIENKMQDLDIELDLL